MIRYLLIILTIAGALVFASEREESLNKLLSTLGTNEEISDAKALSSLIDHYDSHTSLLLKRYLATVEEQRRIETLFSEKEIPPFFALIPYVESKFNPDAKGYGTAGLWQFTKQSARNFGLSVKKGNDERYDTIRSTEAAIRYLLYLKKEFGSWYLADFAYGMGEGKLRQLIARNGSKKLSVLMSDPHFPAGTKAHFVKTLLLQAAIAAHAKAPK